MSLETNSRQGPDFRQEGKPTDKTLGNLWYKPTGGNCAMANGVDYGGEYERVGIAGYGEKRTSGIIKLVFHTEAISSLVNDFSIQASIAAGLQTLEYGYFASGQYVSGNTDTIRRLQFSNEAKTTLGTTVSLARKRAKGVQNSTNGYVVAGDDGSTWRRIDKFVFSSESSSSLSSQTASTLGRDRHAAMSSGSRGYTCGGNNTAITLLSNFEHILFSNDSVAFTGVNLARTKRYLGEYQSESRGYALGGNNLSTTYYAELDRLQFADESRTLIASSLSIARSTISGTNSYKAGYALGGYPGSTTVDRLSFDNEINSVLISSLPFDGSSMACVENLNSPAT